MKIGIIGPSKLDYLLKVNKDAKKIIEESARIVAESGFEIFITPDKGSVSESFAQAYIENKGKKVHVIVPLDDKEFGYDYLNLDLGEHINCNTWRNQPEKFNEETDSLLCVGYAVGVLLEIGYSKWFKPKPVYIINELITEKLPKEVEKSLNLKYISFKDLKKELKT